MADPIDAKLIPPAVRQIMDILDQKGFETWLVGGCVRDLCLHAEPKDFDLATNALPEQVQQLFVQNYTTGLKHGTVTVIWRDLAVEITTFRSEGTYSDSRRPDLVVFHDEIEMDLARRDFTLNSMAWRPDRGLLDLHGGLDDLRQGILRTVGDPQVRFEEDALRLLRAIRFSVHLDLEPEPELIHAAALLSDNLGKLSRERLSGEMLRILAAPCPARLHSFGGTGLMSKAAGLLLGIHADDRSLCSKLSRLIRPDLAHDQRLPLLFLAAVGLELSQDSMRATLKPYFNLASDHRLQHLFKQQSRLSNRASQTGEAILYLVSLRLALPSGRAISDTTQRRLLRLLARHSRLERDSIWPVAAMADRLLILCLGAVQNKDVQDTRDIQDVQTARFFLDNPRDDQPLTLAELAVNGCQLLVLGVKPGPPVRTILERLLSWVIDNPAMNKSEHLLGLAGKWVSEQQPGSSPVK